MKSLDLNSYNFLIIVGSFNNEYNLGFSLYQLKPAEKVITGTTKNREAAKEYFQNINQFSKECGFTTLVLDRNTDIREGNDGDDIDIRIKQL